MPSSVTQSLAQAGMSASGSVETVVPARRGARAAEVISNAPGHVFRLTNHVSRCAIVAGDMVSARAGRGMSCIPYAQPKPQATPTLIAAPSATQIRMDAIKVRRVEVIGSDQSGVRQSIVGERRGTTLSC